MQKLSVVISAYNEEEVIETCLASVSWADEIIVIDNSSEDKTASIARKYKAKVITRPNNPMLNVNKNYGFTKVNGDWIVNLDADESVDDDLKREIIAIVESEDIAYNGYAIPRKNTLFGKWIEHAGWYPDYQNRLFRKGKGKFPEKHVHEHIAIEGSIGTLSGHIIHHSFRTVSQFIKKHDLYSTNEADNLIQNGHHFNKMDVLQFPRREFMSRYFAREGYKDGLHGLTLSLLMAFYHMIIAIKLWEKEEYRQQHVTTEEVEKEMHDASREMDHWFYTTGKSKSFLKKLFLKMKG